MKPEVYVDGTWLTTLTTWSDLVITHRWPGGNFEATWTVPTTAYQRWQQLRARKDVRIYMGGTPIWRGLLSEPNWDTGEMVAAGLVRQGEEALALTSDQVSTTTTPDIAIAQAIARGAVNWTLRSSVGATSIATSEDTDAYNYVTALMDAYTTANNTNWGVNARGEVFVAADLSTPTWYVVPDSGSLGVADEALAARVFVRYLSATTNATAGVSVGSGAPEVNVSLIELGAMTSAQATIYATYIYNQSQARTGWTNGLTLTADQITNPGGARSSLALVQAGQLMRLQGLRDERGLAAYTDIVLAETVWNVDDGVVQCNPKGMAARDLASIVEDAEGLAL